MASHPPANHRHTSHVSGFLTKAAPPRTAHFPTLDRCPKLFFEMPGDQLGHLEHADLLLAVEDGFQVLISINEGLLLGVLQPFFLI